MDSLSGQLCGDAGQDVTNVLSPLEQADQFQLAATRTTKQQLVA